MAPRSSGQRTLRDVFEQNRAWLESLAQQIAGRKISVSSGQVEQATGSPPPSAQEGSAPVGGDAPQSADRKSALREQALADAGVQALLEVFPAEIRDVEEM